MDMLTKIAVLGVSAAIAATVLKKQAGESAMLLSIAACVLIAILLLEIVEPILDFVQELRGLTGLDSALMTPVLKAVGIGFLTQIASNVCADAGQGAIAKLVELSGSILALYVSLPLFRAVIQMIQTMGGGG